MITNLSKKGYDFFAYLVHNEKTVGTTRDFISKEYTAFLNVLIESTLKLGQEDTVYVKSSNEGKGCYKVSAFNSNGGIAYATSLSGSLLRKLNH